MTKIQIIDNPDLKTYVRNITEWTLTSVFWLVWIYLVLPLMNLFMWFITGEIFYSEVIADEGYQYIIELVKRAGLITLTIATVIFLWGYYNYLVFGRLNRRKESPPTSAEEIAAFFSLEREEVERIENCKELLIEIDSAPADSTGIVRHRCIKPSADPPTQRTSMVSTGTWPSSS